MHTCCVSAGIVLSVAFHLQDVVAEIRGALDDSSLHDNVKEGVKGLLFQCAAPSDPTHQLMAQRLRYLQLFRRVSAYSGAFCLLLSVTTECRLL